MTGREQDPVARRDLLAVCDVCLQPIGDGAGAVWCRPGTEMTEPPPDEGQFLLNELLAMPDTRTRWRVTHDGCEPGEGYRIAVERIRTWPAYLHWTAHLMGKGWLAGTNWDALVLDTLDPTSTNPGIRPAAARDLGHRKVGD